jgi:hypothetical protein
VAAEVDVTDLDIAARAGWTADQWTRAEAAGLIALDAPPPPPPAEPAADPTDPQLCQLSTDGLPESYADHRVWLGDNGWRTDFPPPPLFRGAEEGSYGDFEYARDLSAEEEMLLEDYRHAERQELAAADEPARSAWLDSIALVLPD